MTTAALIPFLHRHIVPRNLPKMLNVSEHIGPNCVCILLWCRHCRQCHTGHGPRQTCWPSLWWSPTVGDRVEIRFKWVTAQHKHTRFWTASILKCHKNNMGSNSPGMPQSCHRPWLAGASSSMKSNWLCSTMTAASSRDLETYSRLLGAVLKVWSFKATISYNKFSLLTDSKLSMYLFFTEGRWTCWWSSGSKIRWIPGSQDCQAPSTNSWIMGPIDRDPFACLNI